LTPSDFRAARVTLGLSARAMAEALGGVNPRTIRRWESGDRAIPPPVTVLVPRLLAEQAVRKAS